MALSTFTSQPNFNQLWASLLIEELVRRGVTFFCISPGSRSTPLTLAVANHPGADASIHVDERGSAFMALGYGRSTGEPAAMITTSGTAVANALPAVVEASADYVPLLLLTADRPPELRDTGANQTIEQVKIFGSYLRWQMDVPTPSEEIDPRMLLTTADQAVFRAKNTPAGPVHLNCMFRKPLAPTPDYEDRYEYLRGIGNWAESGASYTSYDVCDGMSLRRRDQPDWLARSQGVIVAGTLPNTADQQAARKLSEMLSWPLLPDIRSGLRLGRDARSATCVPYIDQVLTSDAFTKSHRPDVVLHLGGRLVSKRLQNFLAVSKPDVYAMVRREPDRLDPHHQVTHRIQLGVADWMEGWDKLPAQEDEWMASWMSANSAVDRDLTQWAEGVEELSEPLIARIVTRHIPEDHGLFVASSMPIRDVNRYASIDGRHVRIAANRGASGIDGIISSAAGFSCGTGKPVTLLIGDLAVLHDLNALQLLRDLTVIVIAVNNDGGGIFHFLPVVEHSAMFEQFFGTPHGRGFEDVARMFDLAYAQPTSASELITAYLKYAGSGQSAFIEVRTQRTENEELHASLEAQLSRAVTATVQ